MKPSEALALNVKAGRALRELTQEGLARAMNGLGHAWTASTVSAVEGKRREVGIDELVGLALVLGAPLAGLLIPPPPAGLDYGAGSMPFVSARSWIEGFWVGIVTWDEAGTPSLSFFRQQVSSGEDE